MHQIVQRPKASIDVSAMVFAASVLLMAFAGGMAARHFGVFPWTVVDEARSAYAALGKVEPDALFANVTALDVKAPASPVIRALDPASGTETLLVTGGPYENMQACPRFGCLAWVIDRRGHILRRWQVDFETLLAKVPGLSGRPLTRNFYVTGLAMTGDGGLVAIFQVKNSFPYGAGLVKVDRAGRVVWARWDHNHHWLELGTDGRIYAPYMERVRGLRHFGASAIETRCSSEMDVEGIAVYAPDGRLLRKIPLIGALLKAGYPGLLYGLRDGCDPLHLNSIQVLTPALAAKLPDTVAGDLLISLRESGAIAIVSQDGEIRRLISGRTAGQHGPRFLPDGSVLVFDNLGGERAKGGSRVVRLDLTTGRATTLFPTANAASVLPFESLLGGHIDVSADGRRAMIVAKEPGRAIEIDTATGKPLWSLSNGRDIAPYLKQRGITAVSGNAWLKLWGVYYLPAPSSPLLRK